MKTAIKKNQKKSKKMVITSIALVVVVMGMLFSAYILLSKTATQEPSKTREKSSGQETIIGQDTSPSADTEKKQNYLDGQTYPSSNNNSGSNNESTTQSITMTAKNEGSSVVVTTNLGTLQSGSCTLTVSSSGKQVIKKADVIYAPEYSSCAGFSIPVSELGSGEWSISLSVATSSQTFTKVITHTP